MFSKAPMGYDVMLSLHCLFCCKQKENSVINVRITGFEDGHFSTLRKLPCSEKWRIPQSCYELVL